MSNNCMKKRILWLMSHTLIRNFEVGSLISLGYEVFVPKIIAKHITDFPLIDYSYDASLTLPDHVLAELNCTDFFTAPFSEQTQKIINDNFDIAFCSFYPYLVMQVVNYFKGKIILRAFGLSSGSSYTNLLEDFCPGLLYQIQKEKSRIWFTQRFTSIQQKEHSILQKISVTLPYCYSQVDFKKSANQHANQIIIFDFGAEQRTANSKHFHIFKKKLSHLPLSVIKLEPALSGDINIPVGSEQSIGELLQGSKALIYYGHHKESLDDYLLMAIALSIPVIYLQGGILDPIVGLTHPGVCKNIRELQEKCQDILKGDCDLINDIIDNQKIIGDYFSVKNQSALWHSALKSIFQDENITPISKSKFKIAVFLPNYYLGGTLNGAKNIAKMLFDGSHEEENIEIVFSYREGFYHIHEHLGDLLEKGIEIRATKWLTLSKKEVSFYVKNKDISLDSEEYTLPYDGTNNFNDCDFWLIVSDRLERQIAPIKPYAMVIYDYLQRYLPDVIGNSETIWKQYFEGAYISSARNADFILTTTPQTYQDAICYAGINHHKVVFIPTDFNPYKANPLTQKPYDYFIWPTNLSQHKNHLLAIEALNRYYTHENGKLRVIMTGPGTENIIKRDPNSFVCQTYLSHIKDSLKENHVVNDNMVIKGNLCTRDYVDTVCHALFLWHPVIIDNGTFTVLEAAYFGVPSLSSDYPQMKYLNERFKLNLTFFNSKNIKQMAEKLKEMEQNYFIKKQAIPDKEFLESYSCEKTAPAFWQSIRQRLW
jgi:glycosyltransferase involved in cell wall biosynthesis